jgi:hypothetical protein
VSLIDLAIEAAIEILPELKLAEQVRSFSDIFQTAPSKSKILHQLSWDSELFPCILK